MNNPKIVVTVCYEAGLTCGRFISEKKLRFLSFDIDTASFEMFDSPMFPYNIPNIVYNIKAKYLRIRRMKSNEIPNKLFNIVRSKKVSVEVSTPEILYRLPPVRKY